MKLFTPFEAANKTQRNLVLFVWLIGIFSLWLVAGFGDTHMFPTLSQVWVGFVDLYNDGLITHIGSSFYLFFLSVLGAVAISLIIAYLSPLTALKPISLLISKFRYLPLTGISFYVAICINGARAIQVWVLIVYMTTYLTTSLLAVIKDIPEDEFDHARTLGCTRWEILWEVVIKGRGDYVIEAIRQNLAIVWMMIVTIESILAAAGGLGYLINISNKNGESGKVIALQIIIVIIGMSLDSICTFFRRLIWRFSKF